MPDPTPAPAAPGAPAPSTPPTPPTPPAAPDAKPSSKELAGKLFTLLTTPATDPTEPPKPKETPAPATPPAAPTPPKDDKAAKPGDRQIKRTKTDTPTPPAVDDKPPPIPKKPDPTPAAPVAPPTAATPPAPKADDADFEKELVEEERVHLDDARDAERLLGEKFKGHGQKMLSFLRENARKAKEVEEGKLDMAEYEKWHAANFPKLGVLDTRKLNDARIEERVTKRVTPQIEEERHARWVDSEAPKIKAKGNEVYTKLSNTALPDDVMAAIAERTKGITPGTPEYRAKIDEVQKDYALEFEVAQNVINLVTDDVEEFHALTTKHPGSGKAIRAFHPDAEVWDPSQGKWVPNLNSADPVAARHARCLAMVSQVCEDFKATGGAALKDAKGRWFATREEMHGMREMVKNGQLAPAELAKWWTFENDQIIERALGNVKNVVKQAVQQRLSYHEKMGFKRSIAAPPAPPATPPAPTPPGAPPAPRPATPPPPGTPPAPSLAATLAKTLTSQPAAQ